MKKRLISLAILVLIIVSYYVFTDKKVNWNENLEGNKYEVTFSYFNSKKEIPIQIEKGQLLFFNNIWNFEHGTLGLSIFDPSGVSLETKHKQIKAEKSGIYTVVIYGEKLENGHLIFSWEIK
ncbi:hypothetical protein SAMN04487970_10612 [Paenibacillus tianmuensis]|uniref:Uncharacterized protein n=1 Tax=Paenibacillus tianmuensis TaxID=624147 RepID=A0A1G4TPD6_9BACL|nr:hypothetical protein [Paenibacillus tianmuensis]SCW83293.1 hypothetical protein SAMN04487970_10612 [Paenibacillus tianmuensis]